MEDSTTETRAHIRHVQDMIAEIVFELANRSRGHDASKLQEPEKSMFDAYTPLLREMTYGSDEYKEVLQKMGPALHHHYQHNAHHPEHYPNGVNGMTLVDLVEMLVDWIAASRRHADGSPRRSLQINRERFELSDQLYEILCNTAVEMGWIPSRPAE